MHVVELDRDLVARLEKPFPRERLTVHAGDALKFDFGAHSRAGRAEAARRRQPALQHLHAAAVPPGRLRRT